MFLRLLQAPILSCAMEIKLASLLTLLAWEKKTTAVLEELDKTRLVLTLFGLLHESFLTSSDLCKHIPGISKRAQAKAVNYASHQAPTLNCSSRCVRERDITLKLYRRGQQISADVHHSVWPHQQPSLFLYSY